MRYKLVIDTNALISAALSPRGPTMQILRKAADGVVEIFVSEHLLDELHTTLQRDKFRRWLTLEAVEEFVDTISLTATLISDRPANEIPLVCTDPDDNFLVASIWTPMRTCSSVATVPYEISCTPASISTYLQMHCRPWNFSTTGARVCCRRTRRKSTARSSRKAIILSSRRCSLS